MSHEKNPDSRPLPDGWVTEYSPEWNSWYYVNTKDANPQAVWHHPSDDASHATTAATSSIPAPANTGGSGAPPGSTIIPTPTNPDTRPLPDGWISEYSTDHKTFFYVNTKAADPGSTVTWTHPTDNSSQPAAPSAAAATTGAKENPDKRPLPPGWITDYAENFNAWYYVNTRDPAGGSVWTHPADIHPQLSTPSTPAAVPAAASTSAAASASQPASSYPGKSSGQAAASVPGPSAAAAPGIGSSQSHENPDKRPLPAGWMAKYDENYKTWYYVDATKPGGPSSWEHPADKQITSPAPASAPSTPAGPNPVPSTATSGGAHPQNPDKRPLPAGWVAQYDKNTSKWFYIKTTEHPPLTSWKHPADGAQPMPPGQTPTPGAPVGAPPGTTAGTPGKGLEGLLGAKAGGMVGGFLGSKAKGQFDGFADIIGGEINKFKQQRAAGKTGVPAPSQAPPGPAPSQYQAPAGQAPSRYVPPPAGQPPASSAGGLSGKFGFGKK